MQQTEGLEFEQVAQTLATTGQVAEVVAEIERIVNEYLIPVLQEFQMAVCAFWEEFCRRFGDLFLPRIQSVVCAVDWELLLKPDEIEIARRTFARRYNHQHPGRRVSHKRLDRWQRLGAALEFLSDHPHLTNA